MGLCACGQRKDRNAARCRACYKATRPKAPMFHCEWCGREVYRQMHSDPTKHARRFCSKQCSGARIRAATAARNESISAEREIQRELKRAAMHALRSLRSCRSCGKSMPLDRGGLYCSDACRTVGTGRKVRETRRINKSASDIKHVCPNCGLWFAGYEGDVYCSPRCRKQMDGNRWLRYPRIGSVPVNERNKIAHLIALMRQARRHINA